MTSSVNIAIHKTGTVGSSRKDQAHNALENVDDDLTEDYYPWTSGLDNLDNSQIDSGSDSSRESSVRYVEDELYDTGWLGDTEIHVILYEQSLNLDSSKWTDGAGYANWEVYVPSSTTNGKFAQLREYESTKGCYAFAIVNVATAAYPYSKLVYKNTVAHEVGHTLDQYHVDGWIEYHSGEYKVSPMATWYVEHDSDCGIEWPNQSIDTMCSGVDGYACKHMLEHSTCAQNGINSHIQNNQ